MTFGIAPAQFTITHTARKIEIVATNVIVAGAGQVGLGQRFGARVANLWNANKLSGGTPIDAATTIAKEAVADFASTGVQPGKFGALVAFPKENAANLCEFAMADLQPEFKTKKAWFVSMGYGQSLADPYLALMRSIFWEKGPPTVRGGKFAAAWVMKHALNAAPGFVRPPVDIAVLRKEGPSFRASLLADDDVQEHFSMVTEADRYFGAFEARFHGDVGKTEEVPTR
jgi:hypothetical protein